MARGDRDREELRKRLHQQHRTPEQIAAAMTRQFKDRPRPAWRHAYGWTQQDVADRYNREVNDPDSSMTAHRISDFERWPVSQTAAKPTVETLGVLAKIYTTKKMSKLLDHHDRQKMTNAELITCAIHDSGIIPQQLPSAISDFVGRTHELDILNTQLDRAGNSGGPVVITAIGGTAGIGKTTLALHWARTHIDHFPDGQLYVDLRGFGPSGTPVTPDTAIHSFLGAFHIPADKIPINPDDQAALYRTLVEGRRLVIVLDNARDADQVWPLLPGSPTCLVVVTSRQQLGSLIARNRAVHITLDFMTPSEARQLFTTVLGAERVQAEPEAIEELIHYCVGLPLALNIAAARIMAEPRTSLSTLVGQLREERQRLTALSTGDSQFTDIRAVFSWSYTALSPQAARLFRLLGLHPGPDIGTRAAASLTGLSEHDTHVLLTGLIRAHLLEEPIPGRYRFHDLLRAYATEQATTEETEPQRQAALHRALDYYLHTSFAANRRLNSHRDPIILEAPQPGAVSSQITDYEQAWEWFTAEHAVLLAVIDHAERIGLDVHAWQLPWTLVTFFYWQGHWHDYAATQQTALAAANRLNDCTAQALAYRDLGHAYTRLGHYTDAFASLKQALTLYRELGDSNGQAHSQMSLCWLCEQQGQYAHALTHAQHALDLYRATNNRIWQARALNDLGWDHARLGHYQQALTYCQEALDLFQDLDDRMGVAETLDSLGYAHHHLGQYGHALTYYQQSLNLHHELGYHYGEAIILGHLGDTYHATDNHAAARDAWQQALSIFDELGHSDVETVRTKIATLNANPDIGTGAED